MAPFHRERGGLIGYSEVGTNGRTRPTAAMEMSPAIWSRLPDDLLDRILALLPLHSLLSLRSTCKRFRSLLLSPSFISQLKSNSQRPTAYFLLSHPQFSHSFLPLYDSAVDSWRKLPISISTSSSFQLLSSSSGLLCFSISHPCSSFSSLLVYNLVTLSSKIIASPNKSSCPAILISYPSPSPHGYKIYLPSSSSASFFLYNSDCSSWTRFPLLEPLLALTNTHQDPVFFNDFLYFTTPEPFSVVGFDLNAGKWGTEVAPDLPPELAFVRLVSSDEGKRLFLVGGVGRDGISRSLKVWEMVGTEHCRWEEVGRLPEMMCRKFVSVCYHNYSHVYCLWHQGILCVCCTTWPEVLFYNLGRGTWHWLPKCPLLQEKWSCGFRWFSFAPDLYAMV
ncbi:F-box/kelch-repeat protein At5g43190 [Phalaenopsis equestris]|uniref:F-box/kelch-repeat protein At5g43190 n=1 Tax=Phalaenopsis equestris TaxID=78828 RepID=UPI0009E46C1C|nr:F-box/kelch-repeat protein At5g43190 [Phalaenopsis equestris]